ncbi:MAG: branched-chain amino acid ABC transporter permease [Bacillota bacterium]
MGISEAVGQQLINGLAMGVGYALIAVGLTLVFGILDIINFAHGEFYMLGGFLTYLVMSIVGLPYITALLIAVLLTFLAGIVAERLTVRPVMKRDPMTTLLITFGVSLFIMHLIEYIWGPTPRNILTPFSETQAIGKLVISQQRVLIFIVGIGIIILLNLFIRRTKLGKKIRATSQNKLAAQLVGINVNRIYSFTFGLGCALAAVSGALVGPLSAVSPIMGQPAVLKSFVIVVLGGLGSIPGAVVGGVFLGIVEAFAGGFLSSAWKDAIGFAILILVLLLKPSGLFGAKGSAA